MSSFPPERWEVRFLKDMDSMEATAVEDKPVSMEALVAVRPADGEEGAFRFILAGSEHIRLSIRVSEILPGPAFADATLELQMELGTQIQMEKNSTCSRWVDLCELVHAQDLEVSNSKGEDISEAFLRDMAAYRKTASRERSGLSLRWLLGTYDDEQAIFLIAQLLPCGLEVIESCPALQSDHTRGMMVGKFPVHYEAFDDSMAAGPVPTFFSTNPEKSLAELKRDPEYAFECLQALVSKLLARGDMTREEAEAYFSDPRTGDFRRKLKRQWSSPKKPGGKGK